MALIEQRASKLTGPTTDQQLESAAREICRALIADELTCIPSTVAIMVGNHREGAVALAVGRCLVNRGANATAYFVASSPSVNDHVSFQKRIFTSSGGKCVDIGLTDMPTNASFDIIIDGVVGREFQFAEFKKPMDSSFIASIERPFFTNTDCIFAIAFPKPFHRQLIASHRLYLVDSNLPAAAYKSALPDFNLGAVFGTRMSVRLR
jgi:NAD(P)H-hydrate repair Nnr-like enzyme with NAD(P)H-hydrate epimerase domain